MAMPEPGRFLGLTLVYRVRLKSHNKHGVFAGKYANEEIPMTSKLLNNNGAVRY